MTEPETVIPTPTAPVTPTPRLTVQQRAILVVLIVLVGAGIGYVVLQKPAGHTPQPAATNPLSASVAQELPDAEAQQFLLQRYKGETTSGPQFALITRVGNAIVSRGEAKGNRKNFHFHLLTEPNLIDSFAVPTGDVYVTTALVNRMRTEGELASALAGGIAHVLAGDRMRQLSATQLQFTAAQETEADAATLRLMSDAGYDPRAFLGLFQVLTAAYHAHADVPFFATHPSAQWRLAAIDAGIKALYPKGVPAILSK